MSTDNVLRIYTVYKDHPDTKFTYSFCWTETWAGGKYAQYGGMASDNLESVRTWIKQHANFYGVEPVKMQPNRTDDKTILEVWL